MDNPVRRVNYRDDRSVTYQRVYANAASVQPNPHNDIAIDFIEEFSEPNLMSVQFLTEEGWQTEYRNMDETVMQITRQAKCTVTMPHDVAVQLAHLILGVTNNGGDAQ